MFALSPFADVVLTEAFSTKISLRTDFLDYQEGDPSKAEEILSFLNGKNSQNSSEARYQFPIVDSKKAIIEAIFQRAFEESPELIISYGEEELKRPIYPLWKKALWIQTPQKLHSTLENPITKIITIVSIVLFTVFMSYRTYKTITHLTTEKLLPLAINNTPLVVVRLFNRVAAGINILYKQPVLSLACIALTQRFILSMPEIPYLTAAAKAINLFAIFNILFASPQNIFRFLCGVATDTFIFSSDSYQKTKLFLKNFAEKSKAERLSFSKEACHTLWIQQMAENERS